MLDPAATASQLARVLAGVDAAELLGQADRAAPLRLAQAAHPEEERRAVVRLGLPGIGFRTELHRVYPQRELTAHLVGYVGVENQGLAGIECSFEDRLSGAGAAAGPLDADHRSRRAGGGAQRARATRSSGFARRAAPVSCSTSRPARSLAMVSLPDFDPNRYWQATSTARFNRNTQGTYELGSLFKLFAVAMALDAGVVDIAGGYDASQPLQIGRHRIDDFHAKRRWLSVPEIMAFSSNIGAAKMAHELGTERQRAYFARFGLLERFPIQLARGRAAAGAVAVAADQHGDRGVRPRHRGVAAADGRRGRRARSAPARGRAPIWSRGRVPAGSGAAGLGRDRSQAALADVADRR